MDRWIHGRLHELGDENFVTHAFHWGSLDLKAIDQAMNEDEGRSRRSQFLRQRQKWHGDRVRVRSERRHGLLQMDRRLPTDG